MMLAAREVGKFLHHALVNRPLEWHDQIGKILHRLPTPRDELGLVAAAGAGDIEFRNRSSREREPRTISGAGRDSGPSSAAGNGARNIVDQPVRDLAEFLDRAHAGFLIEFALRRAAQVSSP